MFEIRKAVSKEDIDAVFEGEAPHYHPDEFWNTRLYEKRVFIAEHDGKAVGLLTYTIWWGNTPFLELIHVQDAYHRQGIARSLLQVAAKDIQSKTFKTLISSCEDDNEISHKFHKGMGFEKLKQPPPSPRSGTILFNIIG